MHKLPGACTFLPSLPAIGLYEVIFKSIIHKYIIKHYYRGVCALLQHGAFAAGCGCGGCGCCRCGTLKFRHRLAALCRLYSWVLSCWGFGVLDRWCVYWLRLHLSVGLCIHLGQARNWKFNLQTAESVINLVNRPNYELNYIILLHYHFMSIHFILITYIIFDGKIKNLLFSWKFIVFLSQVTDTTHVRAALLD